MSEALHYTQDNFDKSPEDMTETERIAAALQVASRFGGIDGDDHKMWTIDQMVRVLTGSPIVQSEVCFTADQSPYTADVLGVSAAYQAFVARHNSGDDGPHTYDWDTGITP